MKPTEFEILNKKLNSINKKLNNIQANVETIALLLLQKNPVPELDSIPAQRVTSYQAELERRLRSLAQFDAHCGV